MRCKAFVIMDHPDVCEQIKIAHPDAVVVNRRWTNDRLNGQQWWDKFGCAGHGVINEMYNEADVWPYGTVAQIRLRIDNEFKFADIARSKGYLVGLGSYSRGCPEYNDPAIVEQLKRYGPRYNSDPGFFLTVHNYSTTMEHVYNDDDLLWYELRHTLLFTRCGLDPRLQKIIVTETQVDEGGIGGMLAHNATALQFLHWCIRYNEIITRPIVVNGVSYPSPVLASMIFAYTKGKEWPGHDVSQWRKELAQVV